MIKEILKELILSFETDSSPFYPAKLKYKDFLAHVYMTFDKKIVSSKVDREMNKYKKMRIDVINYIVAHENQIIKQLSK
tara:strand:- start:484 stop:720 length:237 start_codon:yes stop_codon:yes gene_type:complete